MYVIKIILTKRKLSIYCNTNSPQSVPFDCWGTFGQALLMLRLDNFFFLSIFSRYSQRKYLFKFLISFFLDETPPNNESKINMEVLRKSERYYIFTI